jgi:nucleoid-associated protein YgaU
MKEKSDSPKKKGGPKKGGRGPSSKPEGPGSRPKRPSIKARRPIKPKAKVIATHTVQENETWTHLALRYYGDMSEPYWRYMYEFNKELIGDNYKDFYAGLKIEVPELPDHMKKDKE